MQTKKFRNCRKNDSQENFLRHSLASIAKIARITNLAKVNKGKEGPLMGKFVILAILAIFVSQSF